MNKKNLQVIKINTVIINLCLQLKRLKRSFYKMTIAVKIELKI